MPALWSMMLLVGSAFAQVCNNKDPESGGLWIPAFNGQDAIQEVYPSAMAVVYLLLLLYCFMGVGIIADIFMMAIEVITSESKIIEVEDEETGKKKQVEVTVWNPTVANLSLMALGSSAPEILLNLIEITLSNKFFAGALGPGTIVGSAAFNLLVILAICVTAIPKKNDKINEPGTRRIADMGVYSVTAFFSIFAYLWLFLILAVISPDVVTVGEGLVTFLLFWFLLWLAYMADKGYFTRLIDKQSGKTKHEPEIVAVREKNEGEGAFNSLPQRRGSLLRPHEAAILLKEHNLNELGETEAAEQLSRLVQKKQKKSRARYRIQATRSMFGGKRVIPKAEELQIGPSSSEAELKEVKKSAFGPSTAQTMVGFASRTYQVMESTPELHVQVIRNGVLDHDLSVDWQTEDGSAHSGKRFHAASGTLDFKSGDSEKIIVIKIIDDDEWQPDEHFYVNLSADFKGSGAGHTAMYADRNRTDITIINDDEPGSLHFNETEYGEKTAEYLVPERKGQVAIEVIRTGGASGQLTVEYRTKDKTALAGSDYEEAKGTLTFEAGVTSQTIIVKIIDSSSYEKDEQFLVQISNVSPPGTLGNITTAFVTIKSDEELKKMSDKVVQLLNLNLDRYRIGGSNWKQQFHEALAPPDAEEPLMVKVNHYLSLPWKLAFATVPPPQIWGGWLCFFIALCYIGVVTVLIGDIAALFGCSVGLKDGVTAITFVALGTSLPDAFASKTAAVGDDTADNSIGNVTGSNSVNVFLGLGLPWLIAAIYWKVNGATEAWINTVPAEIVKMYPNGAFYVPAGDLGFSVIIFSICAILCLAIMYLRRVKLGYELGGEYARPTGAFLCFLWLVYVLFSSLKSYGAL